MKEIAADELVHGKPVVPAAFLQEAEQAAEAARLDPFQLLLQAIQIARKGDFRPIGEVDGVGRVYAPQIEVVLHPFTESLICLAEDLRHEEQRRADVKAVPVSCKLSAPS